MEIEKWSPPPKEVPKIETFKLTPKLIAEQERLREINQRRIQRTGNWLKPEPSPPIKWNVYTACFSSKKLGRGIKLSDLHGLTVQELDSLIIELKSSSQLTLGFRAFMLRRACDWQRTKTHLEWLEDKHCTEMYFMQAAKNLLQPEQYQNILSHAQSRHKIHLDRLMKAKVTQPNNSTQSN